MRERLVYLHAHAYAEMTPLNVFTFSGARIAYGKRIAGFMLRIVSCSYVSFFGGSAGATHSRYQFLLNHPINSAIFMLPQRRCRNDNTCINIALAITNGKRLFFISPLNKPTHPNPATP